MKRFPWAEAMEIGFGRLRLSSEQFWRMTLPELATAARRGAPAQEAPARDAFESLLRKFPD
ncbi:rcc01693 family protein [Parvibaculum sp.]|uniref:rcc01693 family protein n=1 Tax=Parvibaculum sp. TaxID=2024848 RepID=UPI00320C269C